MPTQPKSPAPRFHFVAEPVQCRSCGEAWARDPAIGIECTGCGAEAGQPCRRRQGGNQVVCYRRDTEAMRQGLLTRCTALTWDGRHNKPQHLACDPAFLPPVAAIPPQGKLL